MTTIEAIGGLDTTRQKGKQGLFYSRATIQVNKYHVK